MRHDSTRKTHLAPFSLYGKICPSCQLRYGSLSAYGYIDVVRCPACPQSKRYNDDAKEGSRYYRASRRGAQALQKATTRVKAAAEAHLDGTDSREPQE